MTPAALKAAMSGDTENFIAASTPGGIEAQEKRGQIEQSFLETLPKDGTISGRASDSRGKHLFEKLGFVFGEDADDIFVNVQFPRGWRKKPTDHSMWSELLDDKGRRRGAIFYKAAFYDRSAHVHLEPRFTASKYEETTTKGTFRVCVKDCGTIVQEFGTWKSGEYDLSDNLERKALEWLKTNRPDYQNVSAYWND